MDRMHEDMRKVESMLSEWQGMAEDMDEATRDKVDEGMMHIRKGLDMMKGV